MLLISACLAGIPCRYDGGANTVPALAALVARGEAIPVCPEVLGGLPTPRIPSERLADGRVVNAAGEDVTEAFRLGAEKALALCRAHGCERAVLKARSPSCGKGCIYDGTFTHTRVPASGVFAALLEAEGVQVLTEEEFCDTPAPQGAIMPAERDDRTDCPEGNDRLIRMNRQKKEDRYG